MPHGKQEREVLMMMAFKESSWNLETFDLLLSFVQFF